jgi:SAM-dependent methyltransferase
MPEAWASYVGEYHDANPGITESLLGDARDGAGRSPYDWLVEAVPVGASTVVDVACGSGPLARRICGARVVGVDQSRAELAGATGPRVQARVPALPLAGGCAGAVVTSMALMLMHPLEAVLAEVARLLRPGGTFVATVPCRGEAGSAPLFADLLRTLGQTGVAYPEPLDDDRLAERFAAAGLTLCDDQAAVFVRRVPGPEDAEQVVRSFYAPGAGAERVAAAIEKLRDAAPVDVSYRIRRLVARRATARRRSSGAGPRHASA